MKKKTKSAKKPAKKATAKKKPALRAKSAAKKSTVKAKTKSSPKKKGGLTVQDLFRMKQEKEQAAQAGADWQHKKDLPAQDQHSPEDAKDQGARKSGFGGVRHH